MVFRWVALIPRHPGVAAVRFEVTRLVDYLANAVNFSLTSDPGPRPRCPSCGPPKWTASSPPAQLKVASNLFVVLLSDQLKSTQENSGGRPQDRGHRQQALLFLRRLLQQPPAQPSPPRAEVLNLKLAFCNPVGLLE